MAMRTTALPMPWAARLSRIALQMLGMLVAGVCALGAPLAQTVADADAVDPPGRVGSVTLLAGPVTMVDLSTGSREDALLNWPVTGGWRIETGRTGRAEVRIGSTALRLDEQTTVDFARLDDEFIQIAVLRGSVALRLRNPEILNELEVLTQRERFAFDAPGSYRIDVDWTPGLTAVTAFSGRVRVASAGSSFMVAAGQRGELGAPPMLSFQLFAATADGFDDWAAGRDAREDAIRSAAYVARETTGVEILDDYGDWRTVADYGAVWFPRTVPATWAPYRYGRWIWISPWGWTWIDEAPWGFAPLHYGRWAVVGGAWGWIPGVVVPRPVYAPALVAWFGAPGVSVGIGVPIGWFPLGPHEVYVPAYRHTPRHFRVVNVQHVAHGGQITLVQAPKYVHRHPDRSTWVAGDRFGRPEPVQRGHRPPPSEWRQYIARPQPPANVPNTKRRQAFESAAPLPRATSPSPGADPRAGVRPPAAPQRSDEVRRVPETPGAVEMPRARPAPTPPALRPEPVPARSEPALPGRDNPRQPPRPSTPSTQPAPGPQSPYPERVRPRGAPSTQAQPQTPSAAPASRGSGDPGTAAHDGRRSAPRGPAPPAVMTPAPTAPAPRPAPPPSAPREAAPEPPAPPAPPAQREGSERHGGGGRARPSYEAAR
jgi:hypothetical protein